MKELRAEILQIQTQLVDLAKWKLLAIGVMTVTGLGWATDHTPSPESGTLLLFIGGFVAAYFDVFIYRRFLVVLNLAAFIRGNPGMDEDSQRAQAWERFVIRARDAGHMGISEQWAHLASSVVVAIGSPLLAWDRYRFGLDWRLVAPATGLAAVLVVFGIYRRARSNLIRETLSPVSRQPGVGLAAAESA